MTNIVQSYQLCLAGYEMGLLGYFLYKVYSVDEFFHFLWRHPLHGTTNPQNGPPVYLLVLVIQCIASILAFFLALRVPWWDQHVLQQTMYTAPPSSIQLCGFEVCLVTLICACPIAQYIFLPEELNVAAYCRPDVGGRYMCLDFGAEKLSWRSSTQLSILSTRQDSLPEDSTGAETGQFHLELHIERGQKLWQELCDALIWSEGKAHIVFDLTFWFNYVVGWVLLYLFRNEFIQDNNVTRVFGVYNVCIGVDAIPARPIAACVFSLSFAFFVIGSYLHVIRMYFAYHRWSWQVIAASVYLVVANLVTVSFAVTYATPPEDTETMFLHTYCFASGSLGYGMYKLFGAHMYFRKVEAENKFTQKIFVWGQLLQAFVMWGAAAYLVYSLSKKAEDDYKIARERLQHKEDASFDWAGGFLVLAALISPCFSMYFRPPELEGVRFGRQSTVLTGNSSVATASSAIELSGTPAVVPNNDDKYRCVA